MGDERNLLFWDYTLFLEGLKPDGFVFENVTGLMNMEGGEVFHRIKEAFKSVMPSLHGWLLSAEEHAIPQRRKRVILIGHNNPAFSVEPPSRITSCNPGPDLYDSLQQAVSVEEALSDLPPLTHGQDGSNLDYVCDPKTAYQALMRGLLTPGEYLASIQSGCRSF